MIRRLVLLLAALFAFTSVHTAFAAPVFAQWPENPYIDRFPDPPPFTQNPFNSQMPMGSLGTLGVEIWLSETRGEDAIALFNVPVRDSYQLDNTSYNLSLNISDALKVDRSDISPYVNTDFYGEIPGDGPEVVIDIDGRLMEKSGSSWVYGASTQNLQEIAFRYGYSGLRFGVCPPHVDSVKDFSEPKSEWSRNDCNYWELSDLAGKAIVVNVSVKPSLSGYMGLVVGMAIATAILTVLAVVITQLIRRSYFKTLGTGIALIVLCLALVAALVWFIGTLVFLISGHFLGDVTLIKDLNAFGRLLYGSVPPLLLAVPFIVSAFLFLRANPPADIASPPQSFAVVGGTPVNNWQQGQGSQAQPSQYPQQSQYQYQQPQYQQGGNPLPDWLAGAAPQPPPQQPTTQPESQVPADNQQQAPSPESSSEVEENNGEQKPPQQEQQRPDWNPPA